MRELQETFDLPPRYGKDVDWSKYSIHDAASVLRRYLNQMPVSWQAWWARFAHSHSELVC